MEIPQNGTCEPLCWAADLEAYRERNATQVVSSSVEAVSFFLHKQFLREFVAPGMRVLEVGAGSGSFTLTLAEAGCSVVTGDVSALRLETHRERSVELAINHAVVGRILLDPRGLNPIADLSFDTVVCFGGGWGEPLFSEEPAVPELARVCRPGGFLLLSVLSLSGAVHRYLQGRLRVPSERPAGATVSEAQCPESWAEARQCVQMFRAEEIRQTVQEAGLEVAAMSASNALSLGWEPFLPGSVEDPDRLEELLRLELLACREEGSLDMGTRIILAGRKS